MYGRSSLASRSSRSSCCLYAFVGRHSRPSGELIMKSESASIERHTLTHSREVHTAAGAVGLWAAAAGVRRARNANLKTEKLFNCTPHYREPCVGRIAVVAFNCYRIVLV